MHEHVKRFLLKCTVSKTDLLQDIKYTVRYRTIKYTVCYWTIKYTVCYRTSNILFVTVYCLLQDIKYTVRYRTIKYTVCYWTIKYTVCYRTIKHTVWRRVYVHFSRPGNFTGWGSDGVKKVLTPKIRTMCSVILNQRSV